MISRLLDTYRRAFAGLPRGVWHLALVTVVHRSGTMVLPFLSLYVTQDLGLTTRHAGAALALYGVGAIAGSYLGGRLSDGIGPLRAQVVSLLASGVGFFALAAARPIWQLAATIILASTAVESFRPSNAAALAVRFRAFALRRLAINVGMTFGEMLSHPMLEGLAASRGPAASRGAYLGLYSATFAALGARIEMRIDIHGESRVVCFCHLEAQPRESASIGVACIIDLILVGNDRHRHKPILTTPGGRGGST